MKTKLTLQEKLRDLRDEKKMTRSDLAGATGISLSPLPHIKKEAEAETSGGYIKSIMAQIEKFQVVKDKTGSAEEAKIALLADQLGVNMGKSTDEEKRSMLRFLGRSKFAQFIKRRK